MPPTRHARREGRNLPGPTSVRDFFSFSKNREPPSPTGVSELPDLSFLRPDPPHPDGAKGYSTDTTPLFLRRPQKSRRTDDVVQRGLDASQLLQSISSSMNYEALQIVASSCALLFTTVQTVRTNKSQCIQLLERVHQIVRSIINLSGDAAGLMAPAMVRSIDQFTATLTQVHAFLRTQAAHGLFARILRHAETQDQLAQCTAALQQALDLFGVQTGLITHTGLGGLRKSAADRHAEVLRALGRKREGGL